MPIDRMSIGGLQNLACRWDWVGQLKRTKYQIGIADLEIEEEGRAMRGECPEIGGTGTESI
jgi:hypothetical protein